MIKRFDAFIAARGLRLDAVVIGGTALNLLGIVSRTTRDCDVLVRELSREIREASRIFAAEMRTLGDHLDDEWLNNGPSSLLRDLPSDGTSDSSSCSPVKRSSSGRSAARTFSARSSSRSAIAASTSPTASRSPRHRRSSSHSVLGFEERDTNPDWPEHVRATLDDFGEETRPWRIGASSKPTAHPTRERTYFGDGWHRNEVRGEPNFEVNIEDTLLYAAIEGMEHDDLRVLAVLVSWFGVHRDYVNADRLTRSPRAPTRLAFEHSSARLRDGSRAITACPHGQSSDAGPTHRPSRNRTAFQIRRRGEDARFVDTRLRVPAETLRDRSLRRAHARGARSPPSRVSMARDHRTGYRGDMWAELTRRPQISTAELARITYGSFATAWRAKRDFAVVQPGSGSTRRNENSRRK